jgi:hypothetical protein
MNWSWGTGQPDRNSTSQRALRTSPHRGITILRLRRIRSFIAFCARSEMAFTERRLQPYWAAIPCELRHSWPRLSQPRYSEVDCRLAAARARAAKIYFRATLSAVMALQAATGRRGRRLAAGWAGEWRPRTGQCGVRWLAWLRNSATFKQCRMAAIAGAY